MNLVSEDMVHLCSSVSQALCFTTICWHTYDILFFSFFLPPISTDYHSSMSLIVWFIFSQAFSNARGNDKSSYVDVVEISDSSGYSDVIEIDDNSSCNPTRRRKRWQSPTDTGDGLRFRGVQLHQESSPNSAQNNPPNQCMLIALGLEEASHVPSTNEGVQLTPLSCYPDLTIRPLQVLSALNERKELPLSNHVFSEAEPVAPHHSTDRDGIQEMCQEVTKVHAILSPFAS
jgi:hypothetical protein